MINFKETLYKMIKEEIKPLFIDHSFMPLGRKNLAFYKNENGIVKYCDLQSVERTNPRSLYFRFNIRLYLGNRENGAKMSKKYLGSNCLCMYHKQFGTMWGKDNFTYRIDQNINLPRLTEQVKNDLAVYTLPFFNKIKNLDDVVGMLAAENNRLGNKRHSYNIAVILAKLGRKEESRNYFLESEGRPAAVSKNADTYGVEL